MQTYAAVAATMIATAPGNYALASSALQTMSTYAPDLYLGGAKRWRRLRPRERIDTDECRRDDAVVRDGADDRMASHVRSVQGRVPARRL
jgi:hypothetical protein